MKITNKINRIKSNQIKSKNIKIMKTWKFHHDITHIKLILLEKYSDLMTSQLGKKF